MARAPTPATSRCRTGCSSTRTPGALEGAGGGFSASAPDLQLGTAVFLVDAGAVEVVDWYEEAEDRDDGVWMSMRGQTAEGFRPQAQVSLFGDDGLIVVLAVEDDDGATLFAVVYRG